MAELYSLPDGWEWKTLSDIFNIERGGSPRPIKDYITYDEDGINWIKISDATKGDGKYIESTEQKIKPSGLKNTRLVVDGDFIMSNSMSFGKPYIVKTKGAIHDGWLLMREKIEKTDKDFFYYLLSSNYMYEQFSSKASGTTVKNLNIDMVKTTNIPLPPFEEQKRIVVNLDNLFAKIDKAIALHQKNIDEADIFMASVLNDVFEELEDKYGLYELNKVCEFSQGIQVATNQQYESYEDGLNKFIRIINYTQLSNEYRYVKAYSERAFVNENDIVMVRYGATAGFIGRGQKGLIANNLFRVIPNKDYINDFIYFGIKNPKNQSIMFNNIGAAAMPAINFGTMSLLTIPNISISIQQKVVAYLDEISNKIEKIKQIQKEKMQSLKELKASILDKAFKGEL